MHVEHKVVGSRCVDNVQDGKLGYAATNVFTADRGNTVTCIFAHVAYQI